MKKYIVSLLTLISANVSAFDLTFGGDAAVMGGYRLDRISTDVRGFDPPGTLVLQDNLKGNNINIWEVGVRGRAELCECFIKGYADFGWVTSGTYKEYGAFPILVSDVSRGHINGGHTYDYSIGLGYHFYCFDWFKISPLVGYSYDFEKIKMGKMNTNGFPDPVLNNLSYNMRWQGPWLGLESDFWISCLNMRLGYEYHWSDWKANWNLSGPDVPDVAFSDKRKSNDAYGNVIYVDGRYAIYKGWDIGLGFKYQYWKAKGGKLKPRSGSFDIGDEVDKVPRATWASYQFQLSVGYSF